MPKPNLFKMPPIAEFRREGYFCLARPMLEINLQGRSPLARAAIAPFEFDLFSWRKDYVILNAPMKMLEKVRLERAQVIPKNSKSLGLWKF